MNAFLIFSLRYLPGLELIRLEKKKKKPQYIFLEKKKKKKQKKTKKNNILQGHKK